MMHRTLSLITGTLTFVRLVAVLNAAEAPLEGPLEPFLGEPRMEIQRVFDYERHPNVVVTLKGTVLVTLGNSSIHVRRSEDGGKTWGEEVALPAPSYQGGGTIVDETSGDILIFAENTHPPAPLTVYRSQNDGKTWRPMDFTIHPDSRGNVPSMHMNEHGITLRHGKHAGRLIRAARHYAGANNKGNWPKMYTTAIYSDDHGKTWHTSKPFAEMGTGEAGIVELSDGRLYYNSRAHWNEHKPPLRRRCAYSGDGGQTWTDWQIVEILPDGPQDTNYGCFAGLVRLPIKGKDILLYSNPDSPAGRNHGTIWASFDGGKTWPLKRLVHEGDFQYSSLAAGRPGTPSEGWIYLHFEGKVKGSGKRNYYIGDSNIARFNLSWVLRGEPTGDGSVHRVTGEPPDARSYVEQVKPGVLSWLESVRYKDEGWGRWKYHAAMERPYALQASGHAISILERLGELDRIAEKQRQEAIAFFQSCQDPKDNLFKDPLENEDCYTGYHTWEQVWGQRNGSALSALERLGGEPKMPRVTKQFADLSRVDGRDWTLNQIDWSNPWKNGESWSRAIKAYLLTLPPERQNDREPVLAAAFAAVESQILDPETGMPSRRMPKENPSVAMAGLFKVISGYLAAGRPVPHAEKAIDFTLALQHEDGEFGFRNNMCVNWDALWVLRELDLQVEGAYRHADIVDAGNRCAEMLLRKYRKPDGGFAFHGKHCTTNHHSIRLCSKPHSISDTMGTGMCLRCLSYADEWNGVARGR